MSEQTQEINGKLELERRREEMRELRETIMLERAHLIGDAHSILALLDPLKGDDVRLTTVNALDLVDYDISRSIMGLRDAVELLRELDRGTS